MKELVWKVTGMHCEGCEARIKKSLLAIQGVEEVEANHETGKVKIKISKDIEEELADRLSDIGFPRDENL